MDLADQVGHQDQAGLLVLVVLGLQVHQDLADQQELMPQAQADHLDLLGQVVLQVVLALLVLLGRQGLQDPAVRVGQQEQVVPRGRVVLVDQLVLDQQVQGRQDLQARLDRQGHLVPFHFNLLRTTPYFMMLL